MIPPGSAAEPFPRTIFSEYLALCKESNLTYLDMRNGIDLPNQYNWFPPTVKTLKCNPLYLHPVENEEREFSIFDNVESLTLYAPDSAPSTVRLYFRNLSEFYIHKKRYFMERPTKIEFVQELVNVFELNKNTLTSFGTNLEFDGLVELEKHYGLLRDIDYKSSIKLPADTPEMDNILIRTLKSCSPNLDKITCVFIAKRDLLGPPQDPPLIDYPTLCDLVLNQCPNVRYCHANTIPLASLTPQNKLNPDYFFTNFESSKHAKHFTLADFCFHVTPLQHLCEVESESQWERKKGPLDSSWLQMVIDFEVLRQLIRKYEKDTEE